MTINEINTTLLLECHYQSLLSDYNNFWLQSNVDFGQIMKNFMWKIHSYNFCGAWRKSNVTSSVTNYYCQKVISKVTI